MASNTDYFKQEKDHLFSTVLSELKALGVKVPKVKKLKSIISKQEIAIPEKDCKIFGVSLGEQEWTSEAEYPIPKFIAWATAYLQKFIKQEIGLFRKAGNCARQRNLRAKLEKGESFQDPDPNDVACLLKQWLRELPEPLIPCYLQDLFFRCNSLDVKKDRVSACLFTILLLPPDHMYTLKHLLRFLSSISLNSDMNKMGIDNLAIIMAPNIFTTNESAEKMNNLLNDHTAIVKLMIENSDKIGDAPPSIFQRTLLGADLHASTDMLDVGPSKYKRKMSGPVQDIFYGFKKLVTQNGSSFTKKSGSEDNFLATPKVHCRQSLSLLNLDSPDFVTPKEKEETTREEKKSNAHARRKSFGALLLRKKDRKRPENEVNLLVPELNAKKLESELPSSENSEKIAALTDNSNFSSLKLNSSFNKNEKDNSVRLRNSKETRSRQSLDTTDDSVIKDVVTVNKTVVKYSKSCKLHVENKPEVFKTPLPPKMRYSTVKSEKEKSRGKFGLSRQEAFSIKPIKQKPFPKIENKNTDKENVHIKATESVKSLSYPCSHSQKSACNTKCDKNKSGKCERKTSEKRTKQELCSRSQSQKIKTETVLLKSGKVSSHATSMTAIPPNISETSGSTDFSENKGLQSLDLSLKLLVQNFCMSPPNGSSEIKLSIDIEASNNNPEVKLNLSQKETKPNSTSTCKNHPISENQATKTRARLSSQSDSKIPRLKILHRPSRQSSFSGTITESSRQRRHPNERSTRHSTKIPTIQKARDPAKDESVKVQSDSSFVSPNSTSESWMDGASKYWSPPTSPSEEIFNKRESVTKILKENPGHVQAKVNLYNLKTSDSSDSSTPAKSELFKNIKITRASSEKYPRNYWSNKPKLCTSRSCSSNQVTPLQSTSNSEKSLIPHFSKLAHKELNTESHTNLLNEEKMSDSTENVFNNSFTK